MKLMPVEPSPDCVPFEHRYLRLHKVGRFIPYNPAFRGVLKRVLDAKVSVNATVLVAHLEWRFASVWRTEGRTTFWKLQRASRVRDEPDAIGGSWWTETGLSPKEIRAAFGNIGVSYPSKREFKATLENERFVGADGVERPYASYFDRLRKRTYYTRNASWFERNVPAAWFR